ncbi:lipid-A-disaccharide synthase [Coxiella-like endosymbiont of Amblyomma americanum]|uniref:lipid-A-disaccharide synthase n=1 Tax=Coxiella-like endosymbiont of Amblyomma americanum TaxID=1987500 RepID=UPI000F89EDE4|nr:lipid-A-disaccharide synthase [Coxiella-like endosymbiont of Amblyomma americanum]AUJ58663.1 lipid-A-disaccharide synthase [Coxiella-like endosymbiont of Amblyomma americanum]
MDVYEKKIMIIAGELSGDLFGSHLAKSLKSLAPQLRLFGIGGKKMKEVGVELFVEIEKLAVVGISEIITKLSDILKAWYLLKHRLETDQPDLIILIDYPGLNLHIAKQAKKIGIKVLYYISPQIWAWRYNRIKKIKKYVDHMAVLFSFEEKLYQRENVPVSLVGHPLIDIAIPTLSREIVYKKLGLSAENISIGLFPGSRYHEITRLLPVIISATRLIKNCIPNVQLILSLASNASLLYIQNYELLDIKIDVDNTYNVLSICDAAIAVSGTVTLEIALYQVPFVILYKVSPFTYWLSKQLIRVPFIGLPNLIAKEYIVPEFIQHQATPQAIADEICLLLKDYSYRKSFLDKLLSLRDRLGGSGASIKTAKLALKML